MVSFIFVKIFIKIDNGLKPMKIARPTTQIMMMTTMIRPKTWMRAATTSCPCLMTPEYSRKSERQITQL